jgi:hypothetical protein
VLLNNHGATVVGRDMPELVSRGIFMCQNAERQLKAQLLGKVRTFREGCVRQQLRGARGQKSVAEAWPIPETRSRPRLCRAAIFGSIRDMPITVLPHLALTLGARLGGGTPALAAGGGDKEDLR